MAEGANGQVGMAMPKGDLGACHSAIHIKKLYTETRCNQGRGHIVVAMNHYPRALTHSMHRTRPLLCASEAGISQSCQCMTLATPL